MKRNLKTLFGATKIAVATQRYQPNKDLTDKLLLTSEEVPGHSWTTSLQQDIPASAFNKGAPEMLRAKQIKSTSTRRLFTNSSTSSSIFIEVTPLATSSDAESWVSSAEGRLKRKMSKLVNLNTFDAIDDFTLGNVGVEKGFEYTFTLPKGERTSVAVAANVEDVFVMVTCSDVGGGWPIDHVLEVVQAQIEKIRIAKSTPFE